MKLLLLLLTLLLSGCSTTQSLAPVDQQTAEVAVKTVLRLSSENIGIEAFTSLTFKDLLDETSSHLPEQKDIPLFSNRLARWHRSVVAAYWQAATLVTAELPTIIESLDLSEAPAVVSSKDRLATSLLAEQHTETICELICDTLQEELVHSREEWDLLTARYEIVRSSNQLAGKEALAAITGDISDHLITSFVEHYLTALAKEEQLLRTTLVRKDSGSVLEVFQ